MANERPLSKPDPMTFFHDMDALRTDDPALAEPIERVLARLIDLAIAMVVYVVVSLVVWEMLTEPVPAVPIEPTAAGLPQFAPAERNLRESWISATIGMAAALGFLAAMEVTTARSLGKRALKLRIVQAEGFDPPPPGQAWLRFSAFSLPLLLLFTAWNAAPNGGLRLLAFFGFFAVLFLLHGRIFFDNDRRAWHDRIAKTRVVVKRHD